MTASDHIHPAQFNGEQRTASMKAMQMAAAHPRAMQNMGSEQYSIERAKPTDDGGTDYHVVGHGTYPETKKAFVTHDVVHHDPDTDTYKHGPIMTFASDEQRHQFMDNY